MDINYNNFFLHNYNIFNNNNIGIGTLQPKHKLDINGNININGNLSVNENIYLKQINPISNNIIYYNQNTSEIKPITLDITDNNSYKWIETTNTLDFDYYNNIDNISHYYESKEYLLNSNNTNTNINLLITDKIIITHIYLYKKTDDKTISISTNKSGILKIQNIDITKINDYFYKLNSNINLTNLNNINNLQISTNTETNLYIKLLGKYDFTKGNMWDFNEDKNNIFVNKNINIFNNNLKNYELYVNDSALISNFLNVNKSINTNICISNNLNSDTVNTENIKSNILNLNFNKKKLSIGTTKTNEFCNIGDNTTIDLYGNVNTNTYNIVYDINLNKTNQNINFKNNNIINFSESLTKLNNISICKESGKTSTIDDIYLLIKNNVNINTKNKDNFYIFGNAVISGNIDITNNLNIKEDRSQQNNLNVQTMNINTLIYPNNIINSNLLIVENINCNIVNTSLLKLPIYNNYNLTNIKGKIYYNTTSNKYSGFTNNKHIMFNSVNSLNELNKVINSTTNLAQLILNKDLVISKNINIKTNLNLPLNNSSIINNLGRFQFNLNSLKGEINNGYKYGSIEYDNNILELPNIFLGNSNALEPKYNNRIINYKYIFEPRYLNIITNPKTNLCIKFLLDNTIIKTLAFVNNNLFNTMIDIDINTYITTNTKFNNIIIENNNNNNTQQMKYTINISNNDFLNFNIKRNDINNIKLISNNKFLLTSYNNRVVNKQVKMELKNNYVYFKLL